MLGVYVGNGVNEGVNVNVGVRVLDGVVITGVILEGGRLVDVNTATIVGVFVFANCVGILDGVAVSAKKPVGTEDPIMGIETRKVRALEETISSGSIGTMGTIGS